MSWTELATVADAAAQPTAWGRSIVALEIVDDRVLVGYGDWNANTGPIQVVAWDRLTEELVDEIVVDGEAVHRFVAVGDEIWAPNIDLRGRPVGATVRAADGGWSEIEVEPVPIHVLDVAAFAGVLFLAGAGEIDGDPATLWRSEDDGATWTVERTTPGPVGGYGRFYFAFEWDARLWVQAELQRTSQTFDGEEWVSGLPSIVPGGYGRKPLSINGGVAILAQEAAFGTPVDLYFFDGVGRRAATGVIDIAEAAGRLFALTGDGSAWIIDGLPSTPAFTPIAEQVPAATAITAAADGDAFAVFLGTSSSQLLSASYTPPPGPVDPVAASAAATTRPRSTASGDTQARAAVTASVSRR